MSFSAAQQKDIAEAQQHAGELIDLFRSWVPKRKATVSQLRGIAGELRSVSKGVNAGRFVGTTAAVAGGIATVAGVGVTIMTGGLAAPLIGLGIAGSVAGGVTSSVSDIIGQYVSKDKMERAQKIMDEEATLSKEIEQKKATLDKLVDRLSISLELDRDRIMGILFLANFINVLKHNVLHRLNPMTTELFLLTSVLGGTMYLASRVSLEAVGKGASKVAVSVSLQSVVKVVGSVLKGVAIGAAGLVLLWDVYQWVGATIDLAEGKSSPADALGKVADELAKQMREIEKWLDDLKNQAKDYEQTINEHFRKLLEKISNNGYATEDEKREVWQHVQRYADPDWKDAFMSHLNYDLYTFHLARVFSILYNKVRQYQDKEEDEEEEERQLNITVISHGGIDVKVSIPSFFYYMSPWLTKVTLYEPWGCAIVASVVYGITTNTIATSHVRYTGEVRPSIPNRWNELPRNGEQTPNITLTPVKIGEPAYQELIYLFAVLQGSSDGLVITYFTGPGQDLLPFPTIPFWVICNVFGLIAAITRTKITIRLAACLSVTDRSTVTGHVPCSQYCTVDGSVDPPVKMISTLGLPDELEGRLNRLNEFL